MNLWRCGDGDNRFGWIILSEVGLLTSCTILAEQAFRPVPQENLLFVEQAGKPVQKRIIDNGARSQITNSKLQDYIDDDGLRGRLSNFQSLQAAIEAKKYAIDFSTVANQNIKCSARHKYDYLIRRDLQLAADLLKQTYFQTRCRDGYVQIDLPPHSLLQAQSAIAESQILWDSVGWRNLMLRIPATQIMLRVIEQLICDRINVNATFVFSHTTYEQVGDAYLRRLESLIQQRESVSEIACFTSFSIARLDAVIHPILEKIKIRGYIMSGSTTIVK
ncbi:transaldolase family protein [Microcoleus sp. B4-D4]|uniref:transaldolase family protein n=1 Tax=Microcoleus sp. B4-D4 TaxID=2818667 RepID=UPI002FD74C67